MSIDAIDVPVPIDARGSQSINKSQGVPGLMDYNSPLKCEVKMKTPRNLKSVFGILPSIVPVS